MKRNVVQRINFRRKSDDFEIVAQDTTEQTQNDTEKNSDKTEKQTFEQKNKNQTWRFRAARP